MFCNNCGKQISDRAKFCNFCGAKVEAAAPAASAQPKPVMEPIPEKHTAPQKKKGKFGRSLLSIIVAVAVYFGVRYAVEHNLLSGKDSKPKSGFEMAVSMDSDMLDALNSCIRGAVYENGYLRYGFARLHMPDYKLLSDEEDQIDFLLHTKNSAQLCINKVIEFNTSIDANDEEKTLKSLQKELPDAKMVSYSEYKVGGLPVIRYIVRHTINDTEWYTAQLIVLTSEPASYSIRFQLMVKAKDGYDEINKVFDTLSISADYRVMPEDSTNMGIRRITAK
ncbi:MAG: zinc ribbon domain-containing protein [Clostridia bacterium]|nr:zinc ribbon domain-containing protein [Clostridia bacterium]